jgi:hypothetical protein
LTAGTRPRRLPCAATTAALLLAASIAFTGLAAAKPAHRAQGGTATYAGSATKKKSGRLIVRAKLNRKGKPRTVTSLRVVGGTMLCLLGPTNKWSPVERNWAFHAHPLPVQRLDNPKGKPVPTFSIEESRGGEQPEGSEEFIEGGLGEETLLVIGRFTPNGKKARVSIEREFVASGPSVGSEEELVSCKYRGTFEIKRRR